MIHASFNIQLTRNNVCNALDTMNTMLLRAGKQRLYVRGIAQQGKVDEKMFGKPKHEKDPDAMLVLFCEKLCGQAPVQVGAIMDLNENLKFQRAWRKATQIECMNMFEKQREQMLCTIETGLRERAELKGEVETLKAAVAAASDLPVTTKGTLEAEIVKLKAENVKLRAAEEETVDVGVKRARGLDTEDLLSKMQAMMQATVVDSQVAELKACLETARKDGSQLQEQLTKARVQRDAAEEKVKDLKKDNEKKAMVIDSQVAELKACLETARKDGSQLQEQLTKARVQRDAAEEKVKDLKKDNEKKVAVNEKLRKTAKRSSTTMGFGTRAWTEFLALDPSDTEAVAELQHRLSGTVTTVTNNRYLTLRDEHAMLPHTQRSLDDFVQEHQHDGDEDA